jgi:hypothetical protein
MFPEATICYLLILAGSVKYSNIVKLQHADVWFCLPASGGRQSFPEIATSQECSLTTKGVFVSPNTVSTVSIHLEQCSILCEGFCIGAWCMLSVEKSTIRFVMYL